MITIRLPRNEWQIVALLNICEGLLEAADIVHRDLKPPNVLYHNGTWKVADFGIARFVEESTSTNTLREALSVQYAAPEQWRLEHATAATDVYALGCIGYALIRGAPPFEGPMTNDYRHQHLTDTPPTLTDIDPRLSSLLSMMLRKTAASRPTVNRAISVLRSIQLAPPAERRGLVALQQASALDSELRARQEAAEVAARQATLAREALANEAVAIFSDILNRFAQTLRDGDPNTNVHVVPDGLNVGIGSADLQVTLQKRFPPEVMPHSKWDAVCTGTIEARQSTEPRWSHAATLWYVKLPGRDDGYRWFEVSYRENALMSRVSRGPFAVTGAAADDAAGPGAHSIEIESGPTPIDGEDTDAFIDRWLERLALAYHGKLRPS